MDWSFNYILSQILIIICAILLAFSYKTKKRSTILIIVIAACVAKALSYLCLQAWSGMAIMGIAIVRNILFITDKNSKNNTISGRETAYFILIVVASLICSYFTYEGPLSLLAAVALILYTFSIYQKSERVYKWFELPVGLAWIVYNIFIKSILGVVLEVVILVFAMIILAKDIISDKKKIKENNPE